MIDTTTISDAPIVTYGPTLARSMTEEDMRRFFASIDESRAIGMAHVVICKSHLPNQVNVECLLEGVPAMDAVGEGGIINELYSVRIRLLDRRRRRPDRCHADP